MNGAPAEARRDAVVFVLIASVAFATSGPISRYARPADPLILTFGRLGVAALALSAVTARELARVIPRLEKKQWALVALAGVLLAAHFALFQVGLDTTSLPAAVSLVSLEPLSVVLSAFVLFGISPTRAERVGVVLAMIGAIVIARGAGRGEHRLYGDLFVLGAVTLYGLYLGVARALKDVLPARSYAALVYSIASIAVGLTLPFVHASDRPWLPPTHSLVCIVALGLVPTIIGHTAVQTASRTLSPSIVALVSPGETLGAIFFGAVLLGAVPSGVEAIGAAIILCGGAIAMFGSRRG